MADSSGSAPPGWYYAPGDPLGTQRYWDGRQWVGGPQWVAAPAPGYAYTGETARAHLPELGRMLADPGRRIVARIIDTLVVGIICSVPLAFYFASQDELDFETTQRWGVVVVVVAITAIYDITLIALKGATVGKMAMGIEVIRQDGTSPPGWRTAFLRHLLELLSVLPGGFGLIGFVLTIVSFVFLFTDHRRRTIDDRIATTYVVVKDRTGE